MTLSGCGSLPGSSVTSFASGNATAYIHNQSVTLCLTADHKAWQHASCMAVFHQVNGAHMGVRAQSEFTQPSEYVHVVNKPEMHEHARTLYAHDSPAIGFLGFTKVLTQVPFESYCGRVDLSRSVHA